MNSNKFKHVFVLILIVVLIIGVYTEDTPNAQPKPQQQQQPIQQDPQQQQQQQQPQQQQPQQQQRENTKKRPSSNRLYNSPECSEQIQRFCPRAKKIELNDLGVLQCIHNEVQDFSIIDLECQHLPECKNVESKNSHLASCLLSNRENITTDSCRTFLNNIAALIFSDYRLVSNFQDDCAAELKSFECGRLEKENDELPTQQGKTISCLSSHFKELNTKCKKQILRITELQSEDFHLDRALYFACRSDRELFCPDVAAGGGRVYKCLMKAKFKPEMSKECQEQLTRRQSILVENAQTDQGLTKACKKDILKNECRKELRNSNDESLKLASLLLCLESAAKDGAKLEPDCKKELIDHRRMLMTDYKLNPDIVKECSAEIVEHCNGGIERNGKTLGCLFKTAKNYKFKKEKVKFSKSCFNELSKLMKVVDPAEDVRVDPSLREACQNVLTGVCKDIQPGSGKVIDCLTKQLGTKEMNEECEERLLEIQFFVARDWTLNPTLYQYCKVDAMRICNAPSKWSDWLVDEDSPKFILSCLYHHMHEKDDEKAEEKEDEKEEEEGEKAIEVSAKCEEEVKKVMMKRAQSIDLMPEIQEACASDLSVFCSSSETMVKGEELRCLQKKLKELDERCKEAITKLTMQQNEDIRLDRILMKACLPTINEFCDEKREEKGELLECLIKQKNNPKIDSKCKAGIEHHQLLNLEDVKFNYKFKKACSNEIFEHCQNKKSILEVVQCLSEYVLNDTLLERPQRVSETCRGQLRFELLQINENINLDPELAEVCREDVFTFCKDVKSGKGQVLECLRTNQKQLSKQCFSKLFKREKLNLVDQGGDYNLQTKCKNAIQQFCHVDSDLDVVSCLRKHLLEPSLEMGCRQIVINRIMMQNNDARLNPSLWRTCSKDIGKFCRIVYEKFEEANEEFNGRVLKCLKEQFVKNQLSKQCEMEVEEVMREAANIDYRLDPLLADACLTELHQHCADEANDKKENCLRLKFQKRLISQDSKCFDEVRRIIIEGAADVFIDHELSQLCSTDLARYCGDVAPGSSAHLRCLLNAKNIKNSKLTERCREALESRKQLWNMAQVENTLTGLNDLAYFINVSESRHYLLTVLFFIVVFVFLFGCFCRRNLFALRRNHKMK